MSDSPFFDTTVLIYAATTGDARAERAEALLSDGGYISIQVLNEFAAVARRKLKMSWKEINDALGAIRVLCEAPLELSLKTHEAALRIASRSHFNFYDALIVAAALELKCDVLLSEDMQHGQKFEGLTIRNPFASH